MQAMIKRMAAVLALALAVPALAGPQTDYLYIPKAGVHEVKYFHGCWDNADQEKRTKVNVLMQGLSMDDVTVLTTPHETGKPSSELVTFKLKNMDASFKVQFRSNDGPHCQQGVHSVSFSDKVLHNASELNSLR